MFTVIRSTVLVILVLLLSATPVFAMHIMEGFQPAGWCIFWSLAVLPFVAAGMRSIKVQVDREPRMKLVLAMAGAFMFVLSAMKLPSLTGSSSHPTGVGLGTILFGPSAMSVLGLIVLLFQAILLAHGGLTTLGANLFSMAVAGPAVAFVCYNAVLKFKGSRSVAVFMAAALGDLATYLVTSVQMGLAFPSAQGGVLASVLKFMGIFAITQIPLAISDGLLTVLVFNALMKYGGEELKDLAPFRKEG